MPKAPVSERNGMRGPAGPPPTEGPAYAGHEEEMPGGGMAVSGSMGPVEASEMPATGMDDGPDTTATAPVEGQPAPSPDMPGAAAQLLSAGMVQGAVGMAMSGIGMNTAAPDAGTSGNGMPGATMDLEFGVPGAAMNGEQPAAGGPTAGEMPGNAASPGADVAAPGGAASQEVQLSGTWRLTLTIGAAGDAAGNPK